MKIKDGFIVRRIVDEILIVPVGARIADFNGLVSINETGMTLWEALQQESTEQQLVDALLENYEVDEQTAAHDVSAFLDVLRKNNLLVE